MTEQQNIRKKEAKSLRSEALNRFVNYFGIDPIIHSFRFPSNIFALLKDKKLIIAVDLEERTKFKSKYELDTWAFVLFESLKDPNISEISFWLYTDLEHDELNRQKWIHLLVHRISYLKKHKSLPIELRLFTLNSTNDVKEFVIPYWDLLSKEISEKNVYYSSEVKLRKDKVDKNLEDTEQRRIKKALENKHPTSFVFKEFPVSYKNEKGLSDTKRKRGNRIDILFKNDGILSIIELKVDKNNKLDVIAQILDYYIYVLRYSALFLEFGWDKLNNITEIKCIILCEHKHPLLDKVAEVYRQFGFNYLEIITKENGIYKGLI